MTREQIIETMARGIDPYAWDADTIGEPARHSCRAKAERCLSALEAAGLVIVPVEPTDAMIDAGVSHRLSTTIGGDNRWPEDTAVLYAAMINAAQDKP
jgi:hypothetical protein